MQRLVPILITVLVASWIISNPTGAGETVHHVVTSLGTFLSHLSGGTSSP